MSEANNKNTQTCETTSCGPQACECTREFVPAVDIIENETEVRLVADVPGLPTRAH